LRSQTNFSRPKHLSDYLRANARRWPEKLAVSDDGASLTWSELWHAVEPRAHSLAADFDSSEQQVIGLLMPNSIDYVVAYLAIIHAGHIALPIDVIYKPLEIDAVIDQVKPKMVITDKTNRGRISSSTSPVTVFSELAAPKTVKEIKLLRLTPQKQIASLLFTSGTTGEPKLAPYTHANHVWNIQTCSLVWQWQHSDSLLLSLRLSHWYGLVMGLSGALYHGSSLYLQERFDADETLALLASGKITMFTHGPLAYAKLIGVADQTRYDLSKVRLFISGSAPLPPPIWQQFKKVFNHEILEVYGTSETGRIASNLLNERAPGSPGRPLPGVSLKLDEGEVLVKSDGLFPGYYKNPAATKKSLTSDGYWRTGDIGELQEGRLVLKGRTQEKIRKSGYTISPRDIEWALHQMPAIKEVYVLGLQQPQEFDDQLIYYLVSDATKEEVMAFCQANLPSVWRPDKIIFLDNIPRTRSGKPQLVRLRSLAKEGAAV
jgi:malonyl-CoA/methylmalonyl-CoA synthetase